MAEPLTWLVLGSPDKDLRGGHGDDVSWTIQIAPTPEDAVEKWVGKNAPGFGDDRTFVVYPIDGLPRHVVKCYPHWEVAHG